MRGVTFRTGALVGYVLVEAVWEAKKLTKKASAISLAAIGLQQLLAGSVDFTYDKLTKRISPGYGGM